MYPTEQKAISQGSFFGSLNTQSAFSRFAESLGFRVAGDFGEEVVDLVQDVKNIDVPKAVILGNHDAW